MLAQLRHDVRFAFRQLIQRPGLTLGAGLTLALGIGANGAIVSVVSGVLLRPLPYAQPNQLVALWNRNLTDGELSSTSWENYEDWRQTPAFVDAAASGRATATLITGDLAQRIPGARVTTNMFRVLGVAPLLGRDFVSDDAIDGAPRVVVLSHGLFNRAYGGDATLVGRTIRLSGTEYELIGVMPAGFRSPYFPEAEFWRPLGAGAACGRGCWFARVVGRLMPTTTLREAQSQLDVLSERLASEYPDDDANVRIAAVGLHDWITGDVRPALLVMLAGAGLVLLIACVNVANLLLARAIARTREIAVRAALGATRPRVAALLLTESVVLALVGGAVGVYVAYVAVEAVVALAPQDLPRLEAVHVDGFVIAVMSALAAITGILFGLLPALHATRADPGVTLGRDRSATGRRGGNRLRDSLVVTQIALALMLLVGAGLLFKSFVTLLRVDPGFEPEGLLTAETSFTGERYGDGSARVALYDELFSMMEARRDVEAAAGVWLLPIYEGDVVSSLEVEGRPDVSPADQPAASMRPVIGDYFRTMRIPLVAGRRLLPSDDVNGRPVVVVSASLAREVWPGGSPIGRRLRFGLAFHSEEPWREVVGVVGDVKLEALDDEDRSVVYIPYRQFAIGSLSVVLRTAGDPALLAAPLRAAARSIDPDVAVYDISTMDRIVGSSLAERRFFMLLLTLFAAIAVTVAGVGIYSITNYVVTSRTREMGIRLAIGASGESVQRRVLIRAVGVAAVGIALGIVAAFWLTRLMQGLLFQTSPIDPVVFPLVAALLGLVTLLAAWLPARRAARVDPLVALRHE